MLLPPLLSSRNLYPSSWFSTEDGRIAPRMMPLTKDQVGFAQESILGPAGRDYGFLRRLLEAARSRALSRT